MDIVEKNALTRTLSEGVASVNNLDLLAVSICRDARDIEKAEAEARVLMQRMPGARLLELAPADLLDATGLEGFESTRVLAALELGRRLAGVTRRLDEEISSPDQAYEVFRSLENQPREHFCVAFLNSKNKVVTVRTIHIGTLNMSVVGPREVFREAVRESAASIILAHNHPSGDPTPSGEDIHLTEKLVRIGKELDIIVNDHIIVGHDGKYTSLRRLGVIR